MFTDGKLLYSRHSKFEEELKDLLDNPPDTGDFAYDSAAEWARLVEKFENKTYTPIPGRKQRSRLVIKHAQILAERADLSMEIREHQDRIAVIIRFEENLFFDDDLYALAELMKMCDYVNFSPTIDYKVSINLTVETHE